MLLQNVRTGMQLAKGGTDGNNGRLHASVRCAHFRFPDVTSACVSQA
jgi:hypothetical protein